MHEWYDACCTTAWHASLVGDMALLWVTVDTLKRWYTMQCNGNTQAA
jgi:hypothetical protein